MIAENNEILTSVAESLYQYNSDWIVRERCRSREDYERHQQYMQEKAAQNKATIKEQEAIIEEQRRLLEEQEALIKALKEKNVQIKQLNSRTHKNNSRFLMNESCFL